MSPVLQTSLPYDVHVSRPLPGIAPLDPEAWLIQDEAFAGQMRLREQLLQGARADVLAMDEMARPAALELLDLVLGHSYPHAGKTVTRRDGVKVVINQDDPLGSLGLLVQEDFCILQKIGQEHVLTGAILCFPASWKLSEKFMTPLLAIHQPVAEYGTGVAARVQRLFDGVRPGQPLWRFNALWYSDPRLFQPRSASEPRQVHSADTGGYLRSERQCIVRLPKSGAVVFSIHTYVLERAALIKRGRAFQP